MDIPIYCSQEICKDAWDPQICVHSDYYPRFPRSSNFYCQQEDFPNFLSPVLCPLSSAGRNPFPLLPPSLPPISSIRKVTAPSAAPELTRQNEGAEVTQHNVLHRPFQGNCQRYPPRKKNVVQKGLMLLWLSFDACKTDQDASSCVIKSNSFLLQGSCSLFVLFECVGFVPSKLSGDQGNCFPGHKRCYCNT